LGEALQTDDQLIILAPDTTINMRIFSTALTSPLSDSQKLTEVLTLYKGDFMDGFSLFDSPQFDDRADPEREHYRMLVINGFAALSQSREALCAYPATQQ
jgi:hypothetical protein